MKNMTFRLMLLAALLYPSFVSAQDILPPFSPRATAEKHSKRACPKPPQPVGQLELASKYGKDGPQRDTVDRKAEKKYKAQMKPVNDYMKTVVREAERYTEKGDSAAAECALTWLHVWAEGKALLEMENETAQFKRATTVSGLAFALMQVEPAVAEDKRLPVVKDWLSKLAHGTKDYYSASTKNSAKNNHRYWSGLATAATAVLTGERDLFDWGMDAYKNGVCGATPEGALPLEVKRGTKARGYQLFALSALVPLGKIAEANGIKAFEMCDGALHRIVKFSLDSITDPSSIAKMAEAEQDEFEDGKPLPPGHQVTFLEIYAREFPGTAPLEKELLAQRPLRSTSLGGDQTLLYGTPKP